MSRSSFRIASSIALVASLSIASFAQSPTAQRVGALVITKDTKLDPEKVYSSIVIAASNVTLDGNRAWLVGDAPQEGGKLTGIGVSATNVANVRIVDLYAKGFETGLKVEHVDNCIVERCDFSDNFTDPEFGWGEAPRRGGIVWNDVRNSAIKSTKAQRNWDGCALTDCESIAINDSNFSHCSDTALKLWHTSRSLVRNCDLSWGLRIKPGETHARDSTCVLIESGSDNNQFLRDDCTHGGDGIFIRVLNGWTSVDNTFDGNDTSFANNNGFESWSPRNTYLHNKANHCSYGFWLGASDKTVLIGNEAGWNGAPDGFHNAPESFGHGGIVFVNGPSSHTLVDGNYCHDNLGGGIVLRGDVATAGKAWKAFHWVIQRNRLEANRWGIFAEFADWIDIGPNDFAKNYDGDLHQGDGVARLSQRLAENAKKLDDELRQGDGDTPRTRQRALAGTSAPPTAKIAAPKDALHVGDRIYFDASASSDSVKRPLNFYWDFGDGATSTEKKAEHVFAAPGFRRVGLTVDNGVLADLAWLDVYVTDDVDLAADVDDWSFTDQSRQCRVAFRADLEQKLVGDSSIFAHVEPYDGMRISLVFPKSHKANWQLTTGEHLSFWLRALDPNVPSWQDVNPIVTLWESEQKSARLSPEHDLLSAPRDNEGRDGWNYFVVPLEGGDGWKREGPELSHIEWISLGFDSWGAPPLSFWIDGLALR